MKQINVLDGFVALDIETADYANSAPCSIAYVIMINYNAVKEKHLLINPEIERFNPIAVKLHKITPEIVKDAPTFPEIWPEIVSIISEYPVVCHNVSFDINVLRRAADRYNLDFPSIKTYCTMKISRKHLSIDKVRLIDVCEHLGFPIANHHFSLDDACGCANIMNHFLHLGIEMSAEDYHAGNFLALCEVDIVGMLDVFEKKLLCQIRTMLDSICINADLLRVSRSSFLHLQYFRSFLKFGKLQKGYFLFSKEIIASDGVAPEVVKNGIRYYLRNPEDILLFKDYIETWASRAHSIFTDYTDAVLKTTLNKNLREYFAGTFPLSGIGNDSEDAISN